MDLFLTNYIILIKAAFGDLHEKSRVKIDVVRKPLIGSASGFYCKSLIYGCNGYYRIID